MLLYCIEVSVSFSVFEGRDRNCLALTVSLSLTQSLFRDELDDSSNNTASLGHSVSTLSAILVAQEVYSPCLDFGKRTGCLGNSVRIKCNLPLKGCQFSRMETGLLTHNQRVFFLSLAEVLVIVWKKLKSCMNGCGWGQGKSRSWLRPMVCDRALMFGLVAANTILLTWEGEFPTPDLGANLV